MEPTEEFTQEYPAGGPTPEPPSLLSPRYLESPGDFFHIDKMLVILIGGGLACFLVGLLLGALIW